MITNLYKIFPPLARYIAILRRNQHVIKTVGSAISFVWLAKKRLFLISGEIETDLSRITTAKIGSLNEPYYSVPTLLNRLKKYRSSISYNVLSARDSNLAARLNIAIDNLETDVSDGALRKQPFCIMLYGFPGTGKSSFAIQIAKALITDLYGEFNTTDMVTLNETDEYQSEFRTSHKVVLFDDIGACKHGLSDTKNPWRKVIDFVNNVKKTALNPNVEMKGKIYIQPDLIILTSNLDFGSGSGQIMSYIPASEAILRRFSRIVRVHSHTAVRPLDFIGTDDPITGAPYLTRARFYGYRGGHTPIDVPREDYVEELRVAFRKHNLEQENFIKQFNSCFDDIPEDFSESAEVLPSQSGSIEQFNNNYSAADYRYIDYYLKKVDWERFFIEWYELSFGQYFLTIEGIVVSSKRQRTDLEICMELFNKAYQIIRGPPPSQSELTAESKQLLHGPVDKAFYNHQISSSKRLKLLCKDMDDKWNNPSKFRVDQIVPFPYYNLFKMVKGESRPKQQSYYIVYAVYICVTLGLNSFQLFDLPVFTQSIPLKYVAKRSVFEGKIDRMIQQLKISFPDLFSNLNTKESLEFESSSFCIPEITTSDQEDQSSESCTTLWSDEKEQVKYLINIIKPSQPCPILCNVQLGNFGEIDLVFIGPKSILLFECKIGYSSFNKAKHQALRYSRVMLALYPHKRIIGMTHTPIGFNVVCDFNASINTEFAGFLRMIGYLDPTTIVEF